MKAIRDSRKLWYAVFEEIKPRMKVVSSAAADVKSRNKTIGQRIPQVANPCDSAYIKGSSNGPHVDGWKLLSGKETDGNGTPRIFGVGGLDVQVSEI